MADKLPLSKEQYERVKKVLRESAEISTLQTPEELHYTARSWNWDHGVKELKKIISRGDCSLATALLIYWNAEPVDLFSDYENAEEASEESKEDGMTFRLLAEIEKRVRKGGFNNLNIGYDPKNDEGLDLTSELDEDELLHRIPKEMMNFTAGLEADNTIKF